jgi:dTDP-4-amino-4,6-dideoxygalactose transaminase
VTYPRLALDIGWGDLAAALAPPRPDAEDRIALHVRRPAHAVTALSVRSAFDALLAELDLPDGCEIVMSAVNIDGMFEIARAHGLTIRPVDVELSTLAPAASAVKRAIGPKTRLVLVAHLFGARADLAGVAAVCRRAGVLLVEDCAQAFTGALTLAGDVALYSFGPIKSATALGGAVALVRDPKLVHRMRGRLDAYAPLPHGWFVRRLLKYAALKALNGPAPYGLLLKAIAASGRDPEATVGALARGFSGADLLEAIRRRPPAGLLSLLNRRLDRSEWPEARHARAEAVLQALDVDVPGVASADRSWWLAPVLSRDPERLVAGLRRAGFDATRGSTSLRALDMPNARRLIDQVVYLPVTRYLSARAGRRLVQAIRRIEPALAPEALAA